jgi:VIT1/CCC1 family predicted Fe2+/Mn2+ transporter
MSEHHHHAEEHNSTPDLLRDVVIGLSDGLTVPFALAAGLSGALAQSNIVVTAGLAEIAAGSIAMALGGYLAARSEADHYHNELRREHQEVLVVPEREAEEIYDLMADYGLTREETRPMVEGLMRNNEAWVAFMMKFELGLEKPNPSRAWKSAFNIGLAYAAGGMIPLLPYWFFVSVDRALQVSCLVTLVALLVLGTAKAKLTGQPPLKSGLQTMMIGGLAAGAAYGIALLVSH